MAQKEDFEVAPFASQAHARKAAQMYDGVSIRARHDMPAAAFDHRNHPFETHSPTQNEWVAIQKKLEQS